MKIRYIDATRKISISVVVYQGPNQTNQDSIKAWLKHEEPNSTRQQQEVINQTLAPAHLNTVCNIKTKGTLNDNSNAGRRLSNLVIHLSNKY